MDIRIWNGIIKKGAPIVLAGTFFTLSLVVKDQDIQRNVHDFMETTVQFLTTNSTSTASVNMYENINAAYCPEAKWACVDKITTPKEDSRLI